MPPLRRPIGTTQLAWDFMAQVELIYFEGCALLPEAREELRAALVAADLDAKWTEWDQSADGAPPRILGYSSPTVLVNGVDVANGTREAGLRCAVGGAPTAEVILRALSRSSAPDEHTHSRLIPEAAPPG